MKRLSIALLPLALSACTTVSGYYPSSKVVSVDGTDYMVRPLGGTGSSWQATMNKPTGASLMLIDPALYAANVKAIEKATGCPVILATVQNSYNNTMAAVDCSKRSNSKS